MLQYQLQNPAAWFPRDTRKTVLPRWAQDHEWRVLPLPATKPTVLWEVKALRALPPWLRLLLLLTIVGEPPQADGYRCAGRSRRPQPLEFLLHPESRELAESDQLPKHVVEQAIGSGVAARQEGDFGFVFTVGCPKGLQVPK